MTVPPGDEEIDQDTIAAEAEAEVPGEESEGDDQEQGPETQEANDAGGTDDQDELAAEWESMVGEGSEETKDASQENTRVLNQNEIDSLLGGPDDQLAGKGGSGIQAILNSTSVSYERLPMLEIVFDRLVRMMSTSLRNFTSDNVEVSLDTIVSLRFGDYLNALHQSAILAVFKAEEWDNFGLLTVDSSLVYSTVDVLLGGRRGELAMRTEGRPYTTIERNLVERMVHVILADLSSAFDPLSPVTFRFDRLETNPRFVTISRPSNAAIVVKIRIDMEDRGGRLELLIPYATLEPVRELLLQMFMGEKFGRDSIWENHLAAELWKTNIDLTAVLDRQIMSLGEVFDLKVGSQIYLNATPDSAVEVRCGDIPMYSGKMGRKGDSIAVRISDRITNDGKSGS